MPDSRPLITRREDGFPRIMGVINITPDSFFEESRSNNLSELGTIDLYSIALTALLVSCRL